MHARFLLLTFLWGLQALALAAPSDAGPASAASLEASFHYRQGAVALPGGRATLDVPSSFRYLGPDDTGRLLVDGWGNPSGDGTLGMLVPAGVSPLADEGWGVVITYADDGHVSDEEADSIDYDDLLSSMQEQARDANDERLRMGYQPVELRGWAEPPHYDRAAHKLYWAKELAFGADAESTLNYCIRVLGRSGVLELNAVSSMDRLDRVKDQMHDVLAFTNFNAGDRYADFDPTADKVASYGIAALVGGAVAAKTGLLAKLVALLIAAKKLVIIAVVGIGAMLARLLRRKKQRA